MVMEDGTTRHPREQQLLTSPAHLSWVAATEGLCVCDVGMNQIKLFDQAGRRAVLACSWGVGCN